MLPYDGGHIDTAATSFSAHVGMHASLRLTGASSALQCRLMCKNELLLKIAAASLVTLDLSPADSAALMACYRRKPHAVLAAAVIICTRKMHLDWWWLQQLAYEQNGGTENQQQQWHWPVVQPRQNDRA